MNFFNNLVGKLGIKMIPEDEKDVVQVYPNKPDDKDNFNLLKSFTNSYEEEIEICNKNLNLLILTILKTKEKNFLNLNKE